MPRQVTLSSHDKKEWAVALRIGHPWSHVIIMASSSSCHELLTWTLGTPQQSPAMMVSMCPVTDTISPSPA